MNLLLDMLLFQSSPLVCYWRETSKCDKKRNKMDMRNGSKGISRSTI